MCEDFTMLLSKHEWLSTLSLNRREDIELAERAYDILNGNIYPADGGYLWSPYRCLTPGNNKFKGIWNWDSAFHAIGLARWDTELAKDLTQFLFCCIFCIPSDNFLFDCVLFYFCVFYH